MFLYCFLCVLILHPAYGGLKCPSGNTTCTITLSNFTLNKVKALPNPFKGFVPYSSTSASQIASFPTSMQNMYFAMSILMTGPSTFDLSSIESTIAAIYSRGHQAIVRVFADYPSYYTGQTIFIPSYLVGTVSLCTYTNYGGGKSPNYDDTNLINAMVALINRLGSVYDGDKRIAVFQTGLLGHWGQHHTEAPCNFANTTTQTTIFTAFKTAFTKTKLMIRYPDVKGTIPTATLGMGYHDDSFTQDSLTAQTWFFYSRMIAANATNQWKLYPIGGELRPQFWTCIFGENITSSCASATATDSSLIPEDITTCINTVHFSWAWDFGLFQNAAQMSSGDYGRALTAAGNMGYSFNLLSSTLTLSQVGGNWSLAGTAYIRNDGVAPFYYDLSLTVVVAGTAYTLTSNASLSYLLPSETASLTLNSIPVSPPISSVYLKFTSIDTTIPINFALNQISSGGTLYIDGLEHSEGNGGSNGSGTLGIIIGASVGGLVVLVAIVVGVICWRRRNKQPVQITKTDVLEDEASRHISHYNIKY